MLLGQAYTDVLAPHEQQALQASCDILIASLFDELLNVKQPEDVTHTMLGAYLPEHYLSNYTPHFLRKFAICLITVAWKLAQPGHSVLASLAEELAAWVILQEAKRHLEDETEEEGEDAFAAFIDAYFEDTDFKYLYEDASDGIEETEVAKLLGISPLAFHDWFAPFSDDPSRTPHPYVVEEGLPRQGEHNCEQHHSPSLMSSRQPETPLAPHQAEEATRHT
jgi:hypothetical protein